MKKIFTYCTFLLFGLIVFSCDKPAPTELINDSSDEYETLNKDYVSGTDTSGVTQDLTRLNNLISVSGIKISKGSFTLNMSLAQLIVFDKSKPIHWRNRLIAYETITPYTVNRPKFDGYESRIVPYKLKFSGEGFQEEITIGTKYVLFRMNGEYNWEDPFIYYYDSSIRFELDPLIGQTVSFDIPTPPEITGSVQFSGGENTGNLKAILKWSGRSNRKISVVVGIMKNDTSKAVSIYRIKTADDGEMKIPERFFDAIRLSNFKNLVFTFVRSYEEETDISGGKNLYISSQSIHSIIIDIP